MALRLVAFVLLALSSVSARAGVDCNVIVYGTGMVLHPSHFSPPPHGYGGLFPWTEAQTSAAVGALTWSTNRRMVSRVGQAMSLTGTSIAYLLVSFDRVACAADMRMYTNQGLLVGSYYSGGTYNKLYAMVAATGAYNVPVLLSSQILRAED